MFKIALVLALAIVASAERPIVKRQVGPFYAPIDAEPRPEPFSYTYQTDSHEAAENGDGAGRVTGYYTLADADGRQRRVDYIADELGFRAQVKTNEVGTKQENSADVEVLAAPPTPEQLAQGQAAYAPQARFAPAVSSVAAPIAATAAPRASLSTARPFASSTGAYYGAGYPGYSGYGYGYSGAGYNGAYGYPGYGYSGAGYNGAYGYPGYGYSGAGYNGAYGYPGYGYSGQGYSGLGYSGAYGYNRGLGYGADWSGIYSGRAGLRYSTAAPVAAAAAPGVSYSIPGGYVQSSQIARQVPLKA